MAARTRSTSRRCRAKQETKVYNYPLIHHETISILFNLKGDESSTRDSDRHPAYASILRIARELFFSRNSFSVYDFALSEFPAGTLVTFIGPDVSISDPGLHIY